MHFEKYDKIKRLGDTENEGILKGEVVIMEKLDGANASFWYDDNHVIYGGRNGIKGQVDILTNEVKGDNFRGLGTWIATNVLDNKELLDTMKLKDLRIHGEWLVKHKVEYKPEFINKFYMYDMTTDGQEVPAQHLKNWSENLGLLMVPILATIQEAKVDDLREFVGMSKMAVVRGEGIVIKNYEYYNKYGRRAHAKFVCEKFQETNVGKVKKTHDYTNVDATAEVLVAAFITGARIDKLIHKIQDETGEEGLSMTMIGRILGQHWQDMWNEEAHAIIKAAGQHDVNFRRFKTLHNDKVKEIFQNMMEKKV